jgi:hypothetical protein
MFAFTLACTEPDCLATFEVFSPTADHGIVVCEYCLATLLDVSFLDPDGCPTDDAEIQVVVRQGPQARSRRITWEFA